MFINPHFFLSKCQYGLKNTLVFLSNLYSVIPKSNELCIHQVPLVTLFFTIYFRSIMMKRRPANHARSSIFFKLKRNSPFLLHPKKVCLYFAYNSKCVCTWTVVREQGQPRVEARQLACERRKKGKFYSSHLCLVSSLPYTGCKTAYLQGQPLGIDTK